MEEKAEVKSFRFQYRVYVERGFRSKNAFNVALEEEGSQAGKLAPVIASASALLT